jgi:hypothetical protein
VGKSLGQVLELDLPEVPNQNSSRSSTRYDTAQSCIDFLAARGLETVQTLSAYLSFGICWDDRIRCGAKHGKVDIESRYEAQHVYRKQLMYYNGGSRVHCHPWYRCIV